MLSLFSLFFVTGDKFVLRRVLCLVSAREEVPLSAVIKNHRILYIIFIKSSVSSSKEEATQTNRAEREGEKERNE